MMGHPVLPFTETVHDAVPAAGQDDLRRPRLRRGEARHQVRREQVRNMIESHHFDKL